MHERANLRCGLAGALLVVSLLSACGPARPEAVEATEPAPTLSPVAASTPKPSASPSPSPSPEPGIVAPLTAVEVRGDPGVATRPALAVKIENTPAASPQAGLDAADIVVEELIEGGVTRFAALFQSHVPEVVGPVRSGRLVDADVLPAFGAPLAYSGARPDVNAALRANGLRLFTEGGPGFYRDGGRSAPHDLFARTADVIAAAVAAGTEPAAPTGWTYNAAVPAGAAGDGTSIAVSMSSAVTTQWDYDEAAGVYRRSQNGRPTVVTGPGRIGAANVVVLATHVGQGGCCDTAGSPYVATQVTGSGRMILLRDGNWYEGRWSKTAPGSQYELSATDGAPLELAPGPTWIHLAPATRLPDAP